MRLRAALLAFLLLAAPAAAQQRPLVWGDTLPATLDPHAVFDVPSQFILLNVYDGLYRYQGNPPQLVPWLAERAGWGWAFAALAVGPALGCAAMARLVPGEAGAPG